MSSLQNITPAVRASGDIRPFRFVEFAGTGVSHHVVEANVDAAARIIGVSQGSNRAFDSANHAESGDVVDLQPPGVMLVEATEAMDAGDRLTSDADGKAQTASAGTISSGIVLEDVVADGDIVRFLWQPVAVET